MGGSGGGGAAGGGLSALDSYKVTPSGPVMQETPATPPKPLAASNGPGNKSRKNSVKKKPACDSKQPKLTDYFSPN